MDVPLLRNRGQVVGHQNMNTTLNTTYEKKTMEKVRLRACLERRTKKHRNIGENT